MYIYIYLFESVSICHLSCQLNHISNVVPTVGASVLHSAEVKNLNRIQGVVLGTIATCFRCRQGPFSRKLMILLFIAVFLETHVSIVRNSRIPAAPFRTSCCNRSLPSCLVWAAHRHDLPQIHNLPLCGCERSSVPWLQCVARKAGNESQVSQFKKHPEAGSLLRSLHVRRAPRV